MISEQSHAWLLEGSWWPYAENPGAKNGKVDARRDQSEFLVSLFVSVRRDYHQGLVGSICRALVFFCSNH